MQIDGVSVDRGGHAQSYVVLFLWTFLLVLYFSLISQWITASRRDKHLSEYVNGIIQNAASEGWSAKEVRDRLLVRADDLSLPLSGSAVDVSGLGRTLKARVRYKAEINMPIVNQPVYRMIFDHELRLEPQQPSLR